MKKSRIAVNPDRPLPTRLNKEYWETFAKLILEKHYPNKFFNLSVDEEKPDLRNTKAGIGIEVTSVENEKSREIDSLYSRQYSCGNSPQRTKALRQIEKLGGRVEKFFLIHPVISRDIKKIFEVVRLKTQKLNKDYEVFEENYLIIFDTNLLLDQELPEMLKEIVKSSAGNVSFDGVFLYCFGGDLYEFSVSRNTYRRHKGSARVAQRLAIDARRIIIDKHRDNND